MACSTLNFSTERRIMVAHVSVRHKKGGGFLLNPELLEGVLAVGHTHLSVKVLSWVRVLRREVAWRHTALTRACSRPSREAHVCGDKRTTRGGD